jgi:hypothetical protein
MQAHFVGLSMSNLACSNRSCLDAIRGSSRWCPPAATNHHVRSEVEVALDMASLLQARRRCASQRRVLLTAAGLEPSVLARRGHPMLGEHRSERCWRKIYVSVLKNPPQDPPRTHYSPTLRHEVVTDLQTLRCATSYNK